MFVFTAVGFIQPVLRKEVPSIVRSGAGNRNNFAINVERCGLYCYFNNFRHAVTTEDVIADNDCTSIREIAEIFLYLIKLIKLCQ